MEKFRELWKKYGEIIRYIIVGGMTTVVSLGVYYGLVLTVLDPDHALQLQIANLASWVCAVAFAYVTNRIFVFHSTNENKLRELVLFVSSRVATLLMDMAVMWLLVTVLSGNDKIAKLVSQVVVLVGNYILSKLIVFRKKAE